MVTRERLLSLLLTLQGLASAADDTATEVDKQLGLARADNPPVDQNPHVREAHTQNSKIGLKLAAIAQLGRELAAEINPAPPKENAPKEFENRNAFDVYLPNWQQQVILDGAVVKGGFGPPMEWFTNDDGTITMERKQVQQPALPPPVVIPPSSSQIIEMRPGQTTPWMGMVGNEIRRVRAIGDGQISSTVGSGGNYMHGLVGVSENEGLPFPNDESTHKAQQGGTPYQRIHDGEIYSFYFEPDGVDPASRKNVRVTFMPVP